MPGGVTVTHGPLEPTFLVRVQARQSNYRRTRTQKGSGEKVFFPTKREFRGCTIKAPHRFTSRKSIRGDKRDDRELFLGERRRIAKAMHKRSLRKKDFSSERFCIGGGVGDNRSGATSGGRTIGSPTEEEEPLFGRRRCSSPSPAV